MDTGIAITWGLGLFVLCLLAWGMNALSLPGNWIVVGLLVLYVWLGPEAGRVAMDWPVAAGAFVFALTGELVEFLAAAFGAKKAGASRRSTVLAVVGSLVGAIIGAIVGIPVPIVGSILAALLFGAAGATAGAMYGEWSGGKTWQESWPVGHAAFWGRLLGTLGKLASGLAILCLVAAALVI